MKPKSAPFSAGVLLALMTLIASPAFAQSQLGYASSVVSFNAGSNHSSSHPASNSLGNTPGTYTSLGNGGSIVVAFDDLFTTSGDSGRDICIEEYSNNDCYWLCVYPANNATKNALIAAGWTSFNNQTIFQVPMLFCGNEDIDLDQFVPGYALGALKFNALMIEDDGNGSDGAEPCVICADHVCVPGGNPPNCAPVFAETVKAFGSGSGGASGSPSDLLGDTSAFYRLGVGGWVTVGWSQPFTTSGDGAGDLYIQEKDDDECYWVCLESTDPFTHGVLVSAGWQNNGTMFQIPMLFCGDENINIDQFLPGFALGQLLFNCLMIEDDNAGGGSAEIKRIRAELVCDPGSATPNCGPGFASSVAAAVQGMNPNSTFANANDVLGDNDATGFSLGIGGFISVCFDNVFSTSGDNTTELFIDEYNVPDCYFVLLLPANDATANALAAAGLTADAQGYYALPQQFCSDENIDIDAFVPGAPALTLLFDCVKIVDDGSAGGDGAEILRVRAEIVCDYARIGDKVYADVDCDGIHQSNEVGIPGVTVKLYDGTGANELDSTLTDANGCYSFVVPAGDYTVGVEFDATKYFLAPQGQGNDPELDSNFDPTNGRSGVITVAGGQVRNDVDALLCIICTGVQAMANNNLPACGLANDPVMTITAPVIGKTMTFSITSNFPNALFFLFASVGPPQHVLFPGTTCNIWLDLSNFQQIAIFPLDANGGWSLTIPVHPDPTLAGIEVVFQGRACIPSIPGPIAGVPDWPGNASHIIFGCP